MSVSVVFARQEHIHPLITPSSPLHRVAGWKGAPVSWRIDGRQDTACQSTSFRSIIQFVLKKLPVVIPHLCSCKAADLAIQAALTCGSRNLL